MKSVYRGGSVALLVPLLAANVIAYRTLCRTYTTQNVFVSSGMNMIDVIKGAEGEGLEEKVGNVIDEQIDFRKEEVSDEFRDMLFDFLKEKKINVKGKDMTLEEKILYSRMFSSSLKYNDKANLLMHAVDKGTIDLGKAVESVSEFGKVSYMSPEDIMYYRTVVCGQFARVFAAALHIVNESSANPSDIHAATLRFVPNYDYKIDSGLGMLLPAFNAIVFGEYRESVSHVINLVVTEDKFYIIEPQYGADRHLVFSSKRLDIYDGYADKLKNDGD